MIGSEEAQRFLAGRPVAILPGVGPAAIRGLEAAGLRTVGDLARAEPRELVRRLGAHGLRLHALAQGRDARPVDPDSGRKACSAETTFNADLSALDQLEDRLWPCCEKVAARARADGFAGRAVVLKLKTADFRILTRRRTLPAPTQTARTLFATARDLLRPEADGRPFRLIGVGLSDLVESVGESDTDLFGAGEARTRATETTIDRLRARFGQAAVVSGRAVRREG